MSSKFGISTENTNGSDRVWPGVDHELTEVVFKHQWPGGPSSLTCRLVTTEGATIHGLTIGRIIRLWRGIDNVWTGVITQPSTGGEGIGITATGLASMAERWVTTVLGSAKQLDTCSSVGTTVAGGPFTVSTLKPAEGLTCINLTGTSGTRRYTFSKPEDIAGYASLSFKLANPNAGPTLYTYTLTLTDSAGVSWVVANGGQANMPANSDYSKRVSDISAGGPANFNMRSVASWTLAINGPVQIDDLRVEPASVGAGKDYAPLADPNIDAAIGRGLPWKRVDAAPSTYTGSSTLGGTIKALLDQYATQLDYGWTVDSLGRLTWQQAPTTPTYHLHAYGQGGARTIDNFATDVYAAYNIVQDKQLDNFSSQVSHGLGAGWTIATDHPYEGSTCAACTAASNSTRFFDSEQNLQDYAAISFMIAYAQSGPHDVNYTLKLVDAYSNAWTVGSGYAALSGYYIYSKRVVPLVDMPSNFSIDRVVRWELDFDIGVYLDDMRAVPPSGPSARITDPADNPLSRAKYGRWETSVDLTGQGPLNVNEANSVARQGLADYGYSARWTQTFIATQASLTTLGGSPVDLATVTAGCVIRVFGADLGEPEPGETGYALDILISETSYDEATNTLQLTPVNSERKDLVTLLGRIPKHRGS